MMVLVLSSRNTDGNLWLSAIAVDNQSSKGCRQVGALVLSSMWEGVSGCSSWHHRRHNEITTRSCDMEIQEEDSISFWDCMVFFITALVMMVLKGYFPEPCPHGNFLFWFLFNRLQRWLSPWAQIWHWSSPAAHHPLLFPWWPRVTSLHGFRKNVHLSTASGTTVFVIGLLKEPVLLGLLSANGTWLWMASTPIWEIA